MSAKKARKSDSEKKVPYIERGFVPCFEKYNDRKYPLEHAYKDKDLIDKLSNFLSKIITTKSYSTLVAEGLCKEVMMVKPDSLEGKRVISQFDYADKIYRAKFGSNGRKILFGLSHGNRYCYILGLDHDHQDFQKNKNVR